MLIKQNVRRPTMPTLQWKRVSSILLLSAAIVVAEGAGRRELRALRMPKLEYAPRTAAEIEDHVSALTKHGTNRRVPCSAGNTEARSYIASALAKAGVEPAASSFAHADTWWDSFFDVVSGSVEPSSCPDGIANVIGLVRGTELPDEVIVYVSHYDGARDAHDGQDQYDDAAAVAVGLVLASRLAASPPKRTVVFFFGDAELGWSNIGDDAQAFSCSGNDEMMNGTAEDVPGWVSKTTRGCTLNDGKYPIGIVDWLDRPGSFIDPIHVKLAIAVDSLGMPMVDSKPDPIAVIGSEATPGLSDLLEASWDPRGPKTFFLPQRPVIEAASKRSSTEALEFCNGIGMSGCLVSRGVPSVWYTQPGSEMVKRAARLNPRLKATAVPKPDASRLGHVHDALLGMIQALARSPELSGFEIRSQDDIFDPLSHSYTLRDAEQILAGIDRLAEVALEAGDRRAEGGALRLGARLRREIFQQMGTEDTEDVLQDKEVLLRQAGITLAELWVGARS